MIVFNIITNCDKGFNRSMSHISFFNLMFNLLNTVISYRYHILT